MNAAFLPGFLSSHASSTANTVSGCAGGCSRISSVVHEMSESLGRAIDAKDPHTKNHSDDVAEAAHILALAMNLSAAFTGIVHIAAHLHDIGKIGVPDAILSKQGVLSDTEWACIRRHPVLGAEILHPVRSLREMGIPEMVLGHHERWDGQGYPMRLAGEDIPLGARILAVADTLSAMLQDRPYRAGMSFATAAREIESCSGTQFDPRVVQAFLSASNELEKLMASGVTHAHVQDATGIASSFFYPSTDNEFHSQKEPSMPLVSLRHMQKNQSGRIVSIEAQGDLGNRIRDMGLLPGVDITITGRAPLKDPVALKLKGYTLTLRNNEADHILVEPVE